MAPSAAGSLPASPLIGLPPTVIVIMPRSGARLAALPWTWDGTDVTSLAKIIGLDAVKAYSPQLPPSCDTLVASVPQASGLSFPAVLPEAVIAMV